MMKLDDLVDAWTWAHNLLENGCFIRFGCWAVEVRSHSLQRVQ